MSLSLSLAESVGMALTVTDSEAADGNPSTGFDLSAWAVPATLTSSTTPPITKHAKGTATMSNGSVTLDLTAIAGSGGNVDFTGLKIQVVFFKCPSTNANKITVAKGGSSGYGLDAAGATWTLPLDPSSWELRAISDTAPDVDNTHKNIDVTGTGAQTLQYWIIGG